MNAAESAVELPADALSALHEGRQAYVAVDASSGPHVTPELYSLSGDRIWFATAVTTVKAKVLQRTRAGAVCVAVPGRVVLLQGKVESYDPRRPLDLAAHARTAPAAARALVTYGVRNASDLVAFASDLGRGRLGRRTPPLRALFALTPDGGAIVERGTVGQRWGSWASDPDVDAHEAPVGGIPVVAAVPGPMALPATWFPDDASLHLEGGLAAHLPSGSSFPISMVGDEYSAPGPDAKQGLLLRGVAHRTDEPNELAVELDRIVEWDGVETSTVDLGS